MEDVRKELETLADPAYRAFQAKLVPIVDAERILGVRTPALRKYARSFADDPRAASFLEELPHATYDEMNLHGELIGLRSKTAQDAFALLDRFLPWVDNWATCDLVRVPAFKRDKRAVLEKIRAWARSPHEYAVRFAVVQLMTLFLDDDFEPEQLSMVAGIARPEYYVNMARAWYFSLALAKQREATLPLFEARTLDAWTHDKALQKACESRRTTDEDRRLFRSLKTTAKGKQ